MADTIEILANSKTLEIAYFNLRVAVLRSCKKSIDYNINLINNIIDFNPSLLNDFDSYYHEELNKIKNIINSGSLPFSLDNPVGNEDEIMEVYDNVNFQFKLEKQLRNKIFYDDFNKVNEATGLNLIPIGIEIKNNYGFVDILAKNNDDEIWIIELKKDRGDFKLVSQIAKYVLAYEEKLINKTFRIVKSMSISNGYTRFCKQNLKKMGVLTLHYELINNNLILKYV